jgi:hypothetical protein
LAVLGGALSGDRAVGRVAMRRLLLGQDDSGPAVFVDSRLRLFAAALAIVAGVSPDCPGVSDRQRRCRVGAQGRRAGASFTDRVFGWDC